MCLGRGHVGANREDLSLWLHSGHGILMDAGILTLRMMLYVLTAMSYIVAVLVRYSATAPSEGRSHSVAASSRVTRCWQAAVGNFNQLHLNVPDTNECSLNLIMLALNLDLTLP
jgi:hypothetical protein